MGKCQRCTTQVADYLFAEYMERHGKPSQEKILVIANEAAKICVEEGNDRGWTKEVNEEND